MPVTLQNVENGHVLYIVISDPWNIEEIAQLQPATSTAIADASHKVHSMVVVQTRKIPGGLLQVRPTPRGLARPNNGQIVIVGAPKYLEAIAEAMFKLAHFTRSTFYDNESDAWAYLHKIIAEEHDSAQQDSAQSTP
jgi:hypothetical protein